MIVNYKAALLRRVPLPVKGALDRASLAATSRARLTKNASRSKAGSGDNVRA